MTKGICYGVSVGPGQKELITLEAISIIEKSDIIFLPSFPKEECKAYQIIKKIMPEIDKKDLRAETFIMSRDAKVKDDRHDEIFSYVCPLLDEGKNIAFLTLGEVTLFSTYLYIHERLINAGYESVLINGISSVQAIAAKLGIPLAIGNQEIHLFPNSENLEAKLSLPGTKIFMKTRANLEKMIEDIKSFAANNPGTEARGISNCGMDGEIIAKSIDELFSLKGYFTVIIVNGENPDYGPSASYYENRSCEYYPCHKGAEHLNCLFCYCPMYKYEDCLGNPSFKQKDGRTIKVCTGCSFPHQKNHYKDIMDFLKNK